MKWNLNDRILLIIKGNIDFSKLNTVPQFRIPLCIYYWFVAQIRWNSVYRQRRSERQTLHYGTPPKYFKDLVSVCVVSYNLQKFQDVLVKICTRTYYILTVNFTLVLSWPMTRGKIPSVELVMSIGLNLWTDWPRGQLTLTCLRGILFFFPLFQLVCLSVYQNFTVHS